MNRAGLSPSVCYRIAIAVVALQWTSRCPAQYVPPPAPTSVSLSQLSDLANESSRGSVLVPMDSWVYPSLNRLSGLGLIPSQALLIQPWTRQECLRQVLLAKENHEKQGATDDVAGAIIDELLREFSGTNESGLAVDSIYARYGSIMGSPLTDGLHFGQTWRNDFGRPFNRGGNAIVGGSARFQKGRYLVFAREEIQQIAGKPSIPQSQADLLNAIDNINPLLPGPVPFAATNAEPAYIRQRPIELYAGVRFGKEMLSFGKQQIYWGSSPNETFSFSKNAEPTYNLRLMATQPHRVPFLSNLATFRYDLVFGKLSGQVNPARPYFNGVQLEFAFGNSLEIGLNRWSVLWGQGHPMTVRSLFRNILSGVSTGTYQFGDRTDPGDRKSGFDFNLHLPGRLRPVSIYAEAYADDEPNPMDAPRRAAWYPGIYVARLFSNHLDARFEVSSTQAFARDEGGSRFFINANYRAPNTNEGMPLGTALGKDGRAMLFESTYWHSSKKYVKFFYRQTKISQLFLPGGGTISDGGVSAVAEIRKDLVLQAFGQVERYFIPSLRPEKKNVSAWLQFTWYPGNKLHLRRDSR